MKFFRREKWASLLQRYITWFPEGTEIPEPRAYEALASLTYQKNALVYACIRRIASSASTPDLNVLTIGEDGRVQINNSYTGDALASLIHQPNPEQDQYEFFETLLTHLEVAGNTFIYKVRSSVGGPPIGLELIRPDLMGIVPSKERTTGKISHYTVRIPGTGEYYPVDPKDIIHIRLPDALDEYWGLSPLAVCARYADIDLQSAEFLRAFFKNKGIPSGLLKFKNQVQKEERERIRDLWKAQFSDIKGWYNVAVLDADVEYTPLATGIDEMNIDGLNAVVETRICMTFGVDSSLIGGQFGKQHLSFSSMEVAERLFWMNTMAPIFTLLSRKLTAKLAEEEFGPNRRIAFDLSTVPALQEHKSETRKVALQGWRDGLMTRNQSFKMLGIPQVDEGGNVYRVPVNATFVPADTNQVVGG